MSDVILTPNMSLLKPIPGQDPGQQYGIDQNASFDLIDSHDHSPGKGVPVTPSGLDISSDLSFGGNNATALRSTRFEAQDDPLALPDDLGCAYVSGVDLYFNDGNGNQIRITQDGGVAGSPGSISNLTSPASASYVAAQSKFVWESDEDTAADMDGGSVLIREKVANAKAVTIASPSSLAANYQLTLPAALPGSTKILTVDVSGNVGDAYDVDNVTLQVASNLLKVKDGGVTGTKLAPAGQQVSSGVALETFSSSSFSDVSNCSVSLTTTGRPVEIKIQPRGSSAGAWSLDRADASAGTAEGEIQLLRDAVVIAKVALKAYVPASDVAKYSPCVLSFIDVPGAGTYTYKIQARSVDGTVSELNAIQVALAAYQLGTGG